MEATLLTFRWQNILAIWIMVIGLGLLMGAAGQIWNRSQGG